MPIETADDLAAFFDDEEFAASAVYTPFSGPAISLAVLRDQGTLAVGDSDAAPLVDVNSVLIPRAVIASPSEGEALVIDLRDDDGAVIGQESFTIQGGARLDRSGQLWTCFLEPV